MARAALYYRVSTRDQDPQRQIDELREYAQRRGFEIEGEYIDHGVSGATRQRPELDRLLAQVRTRKVDIVLVWAFDRFARSTSHLVNTLEEFQALGVDFISYNQQIDTSTPGGKLTFTVLAGVAEFERELIRERVNSGLDAARREGKKLGRPPIKGVIAEKLREAKEKGLTYREIAKSLKVSVGTAHNYCKALKDPEFIKVEK